MIPVRSSGPGRLLLLVLLVSILVRVDLVLSGGQFYWPDEGRYDDSRRIVAALAEWNLDELSVQLNSADHWLFRFIGAIPAAIERAVGQEPKVPALFFAMFSVCSIWLLGRVSKSLGASDWEALMASALLALSSTSFYYARHLFPYDVAMTLGLAAIHAGVRSGSYFVGSLLCGVLAGCTFLAYSGYWTMAALAPLLHVFTRAQGAHDRIRRALVAGAGLVLPPGLLIGTSALLGGHLLEELISFSRAVNQGSYEEGWRLPFEYLWHAEHLVLLVWLVALASVVWFGRPLWHSPRYLTGVVAIAFVFAALAVSSTILERFVVYGRLARQLVPFLCVATACALEQARLSKNARVRWLAPMVMAIVTVQAAINFRQPLRQTFPSEFREANEAKLVAGMSRRVIWMNTEHIYPEPVSVALPDRYVLLAQARHPLQFLPYQYEGYTPDQRRALRSADIRMKLVAELPDNSGR